MHSSTAVAGRALIMLACVVGIPVVALSGTSWADMVKRLQDYHWPAILGLASTTTPAVIDGVSPPDMQVPLDTSGTNAGEMPVFAAESPRQLGRQPDAAPTLALQSRPLDTHSAVVPVSYQAPKEMTPTGANLTGVNDPKGLVAQGLTAEPFRAVQERLRQLGATYYLLESWGNDQQMYRFYCKMAIGGSADYTRCFEATNADPLQAMSQVLRQVENQRQGVDQGATMTN